MARLARVVAPGIPHHIIQRGNRRQQTFFDESDYIEYINLMSHWCKRYGVDIWAYCLMPNHVHLIAVPPGADGLKLAIGEAHRRYSRMINFRNNWRGHLWQGRFSSYPMDENYLLAAARYIEMNPVRAALVERAEDYPFSSASAHLNELNDKLINTKALLDIVGNWADFLKTADDDDKLKDLKRHENTGRPLGNNQFISRLESKIGRALIKQKPGPKGKRKQN